MPHQIGRKPVDSGWDGGVGGEDRAGSHRRQRRVEVQGSRGDEFADAFDTEEACVALVHVEHLGIGQPVCTGVGPDRSNSTDTGEYLLLDAVILVAAVQPVGHPTQLRVVVGDVGIEQQQRDASHLGDPHPCPQNPRSGHRHMDQHRRVAVVGEQPQRQTVRVEGRIAFGLPAVGSQRLAEVARAVEQSDTDQRQSQVGGSLEVVAGQDSEPAGVVRQHLGDTELHREITDARRQSTSLGQLVLVPERAGEVVVQIRLGGVQLGQEALIGREFLETRRCDGSQYGHRVALEFGPQQWIDVLEQILRRRVPRPPEVCRELGEGIQADGKVGSDGESAQSFHRVEPYPRTPVSKGCLHEIRAAQLIASSMRRRTRHLHCCTTVDK